MEQPHWFARSQLKPSLNRDLSTKSDGATRQNDIVVAWPSHLLEVSLVAQALYV
jgi:hypothetical protein